VIRKLFAFPHNPCNITRYTTLSMMLNEPASCHTPYRQMRHCGYCIVMIVHELCNYNGCPRTEFEALLKAMRAPAVIHYYRLTLEQVNKNCTRRRKQFYATPDGSPRAVHKLNIKFSCCFCCRCCC